MNDYTDNNSALRVAIIHTSKDKPEALENALTSHNIDVVACAELSYQSLCEIDNNSTDAILVDLSENAEAGLDILESLLEESSLPLLFNDSATTEFNISIASPDWSKKLSQKLRRLVARSAEVAAPTPELQPAPAAESVPEAIPEPEPILVEAQTAATAPASVTASQAAERVWVLGASLGGPLAVKEFLACLPAKLPLAFVLAQHIGESHIDLLGEQLDRATELDVMTASEGHVIKHNEVILAPIEKRIVIDSNGEVSLQKLETDSIYTPSIDDVMADIAQTYNNNTGAIIFSGMGNDGEKGCQVINAHGGVIWAQEPESCVISSMPDCARRTGFVEYSGTPQELADKLIQTFSP